MKDPCKSCAYHNGLYDHTGKKTADWCVKRNGRIHKAYKLCKMYKPKGASSVWIFDKEDER